MRGREPDVVRGKSKAAAAAAATGAAVWQVANVVIVLLRKGLAYEPQLGFLAKSLLSWIRTMSTNIDVIQKQQQEQHTDNDSDDCSPPTAGASTCCGSSISTHTSSSGKVTGECTYVHSCKFRRGWTVSAMLALIQSD